ncbi:hypothetical protein RIV07_20790 [Pseudomonas baetica]|nr:MULTISPECIES: hypothetical protein [Pseudomonas]MDR9864382.1 hypothetical protein [Pseudomonas baetica]
MGRRQPSNAGHPTGWREPYVCLQRVWSRYRRT